MTIIPNGMDRGGGLLVAAPSLSCVPFRYIWLVDFEFQAPPGERPLPVCMVAKELCSGREIRLWRDELLALRQAPFDTGPDSLFVAYSAAAELGCFLELGWELPARVVDLLAEHRVETNGLIGVRNSLLGALTRRGLDHIDADEKDAMRRLVLEHDVWSHNERLAILDYCASDVTALAELLPVMAPKIDWLRAPLRGRYMGAVARIHRAGVPIDVGLFNRLRDRWDDIQHDLTWRTDDLQYNIFLGDTFKHWRFERFLAVSGIPWPRTERGRLATDAATFAKQVKLHPELGPLMDLRAVLGSMRLRGLEVGWDGRNRCYLAPFGSKTGRNQPSTSRFIFSAAKWERGLIRPPEGYGIAYIDFSAQEIGIAAAMSGDERMLQGYASGDPYIAFAIAAKLAPPGSTKHTHPEIRKICKEVVLGTLFGLGRDGLAAKVDIAPIEAQELLDLHRRTYQKFWGWNDGMVTSAMFTNEIQTVFGWKQHLGHDLLGGVPNARSFMNFPMQANGAEMMRIAAIAGTEAGIEVCAPVHDAFLIAAPLERLDDDVRHMQELMTRAGNAVTGGLDIRTDAKMFKWPDRYFDEEAVEMWDQIMGVLDAVEGYNKRRSR